MCATRPWGIFAQLLQSALLDRPVVDQTGLDGRWDFTLKWTPDDAQFAAMGAPVRHRRPATLRMRLRR
jgi:uncharacterized protein (TIGR03435 family)